MDITPDKKGLMLLVDKATAGQIVLPEFQRNFVWGRDDIRDLLVSILRNYFIGTFLFLRADHEDTPFAIRPIAGLSTSIQQLKPEWMVLDGQQRITSLYYVFNGPNTPLRWTKYPYRFFLDLNKVLKDDIDEAIFSERADWCEEYYDETNQFNEFIVPFTRILSWEDWQHRFEKYWIERDKDFFLDEYHPNMQPIWSNAIATIRNFPVPVIELPKVKRDNPQQIAEVCAIFEKMNSTGVPLSVYDLLTARLWKDGIDVHRLWLDTLEKHELIRKFSNEDPDPYGTFILRTIALMRDKEVKSKALVTLEPDNFPEDWQSAAVYIEKALKRIASISADGFGVTDSKWFPYTTMTPVLAALLHEAETSDVVADGLKAIRRWYWSSVFLERYAGSTDTLARKDYVQLCAYMHNSGKNPEVFDEASRYIVDDANYSLLDTTRRNAVYKGIMNLIAKKGAKDFMADDSIEFWDLDDHHIFPQAYLRKKGRSDSKSNTILNKTLISATTNRKISRTKPSEYIEQLIPASRQKDILKSHFIKDATLTSMKRDDYEEFLTNRDADLIIEVRKLVK